MNVHRSRAAQAIAWATELANMGSMSSSAKLALQDSIVVFNRGEFRYAINRALDSLSYSVGIFHEKFRIVVAWKREAVAS